MTLRIEEAAASPGSATDMLRNYVVTGEEKESEAKTVI
jgi:hypothetical protein